MVLSQLTNMGIQASGELPEALTEIESDLAIARILLERNPENEQHKADLDASLEAQSRIRDALNALDK